MTVSVDKGGFAEGPARRHRGECRLNGGLVDEPGVSQRLAEKGKAGCRASAGS